MHTLAQVGDAAPSLIVSLALLLPPGYALLHLLGSRLSGTARLAAAFALGYTVVLPLLWAEIRLGRPWLVLPVCAAALLWLRPGISSLRAARALAPDLGVALLLAAYAFVANVGDVSSLGGGVSVRYGFDVTDRLFYTTVAAELTRAPASAIENPVFSGTSLTYSYLPSLAGLLIHLYAGVPLLVVFVAQLPALAMFFVGVATLGLSEEWSLLPRSARWIAALLVALGGDLSYLGAPAPWAIERLRHFLMFFSFSAESLLYNTWMFGLPIALASLILARRHLAEGSRGDLLAGALVLGCLWQTKVFAFAALWLGCVAAGLLGRRRRPLILAAAAGLVALPLALWTLISGAGQPPLALAPLYLVDYALASTPSLAALGLAPWAFTPLFLAGGFGLRLLGSPLLVREWRRDETGGHALLGSTIVASTAAALLFRGQPTDLEAVQFLFVAHSLAWLYAAPVLAGLLLRPQAAYRLGAALLLAAAVFGPVRYVGRKWSPEWFSAPGSFDSARAQLTPTMMEACRFLERSARPTDRILVPVDLDRGARPLIVSALSGRRVAAQLTAFGIGRTEASRRAELAKEFFATSDPARALTLLRILDAQWVWEDPSRPLGYQPAWLDRAFASPDTRLYRVRPRD
jgi:hypothetical protein